MKRVAVAVVLLVGGYAALNAYVRFADVWPPGAITMHLQLGSSGGALLDGSADWGGSAEAALAAWNQKISTRQFAIVRNSAAPLGNGNGYNNVFFSNTIYGTNFGSGVLAVTTHWLTPSTNTRTEGDVIFNRAFGWNSYPGPLQSGVIDFRRVATHEFGHVLGLTHPDQNGQVVSALMNSTISNLDHLTADDIAGAQALYGAVPAMTVTLSPDRAAPQMAGTGINLTASATGGTAPYQYKWWLFDGSTWMIVRDWSTAATFTWAPTLANANYRVGVWARSAGVTADDSLVNLSIPYAITARPSMPTLTGITSTVASPQVSGTPITFTANVTGGTAPYQYKWWLFDGATWTMARDWSTAATFAWTPTQARETYRVGVWVRNSGVTADDSSVNLSVPYVITAGSSSSPLSLTGISPNLASPQVSGIPVTFTANVTGGTAPYQFKWWLFDGTTWTIARDWSTVAPFTWTPTQARSTYRIGVWVRNAGVTADDSSANLSVPYVITAGSSSSPLSLTGISPGVASPQVSGTPITFTANVTGGTTPYQYKWWLFDGATWTIARDWSAAATFAWTPTQARETYRVGVWVRNAGVTADDSSVNLSVPYMITAGSSSSPLSLTGISPDVASPQMSGIPVTFTADVTGGTAPYQYKWWLFDGTTWTIARDWSTAAPFTWTPTQAQSAYRIGVWVRNAGVTADDRSVNQSVPYVITDASMPLLTTTAVTIDAGTGDDPDGNAGAFQFLTF